MALKKTKTEDQAPAPEPAVEQPVEEEAKTSEELIAEAEEAGNRDVDQRTKDEKRRDSQAAKPDPDYDGDAENHADYMEAYS